MSSDEKQKICVECRALVANDAEACPECGYPFDDHLTTRCRSCNSIIVSDVETCPVCGQLQADPPVEKPVDSVVPIAPVEPATPEVPVVSAEPAEEGTLLEELPQDFQDDVGTAPEPVAGPPAVPVEVQAEERGVAPAEIRELVGVKEQEIKNNELVKQLIESNEALIRSIGEYQKDNQITLQQVVDAIKTVVESSTPKENKEAELLEMITDLKTAIADVAAQNSASANMIVGAVNSSAAKIPEPPVIELPGSLKWLDYLFVAIIVALIFSMGNLLIMAYVARLIMNSME